MINVNKIASLLYQFTTILSLFTLVVFLYVNFDLKTMDVFFVALAYITPIYTFSLLGNRQLYFSGKIRLNNFITCRFYSSLLFVMFSVVILKYVFNIDNFIIFLVCYFRVIELYFDYKACESQEENKIFLLLSLSLGKMFIYLLIFFMSYWVYIIYVLILIFIILDYILKIRFDHSFKLNNEMLVLSLVATLASFIVVVPRIFLSKNVVNDGDLSFISIFSYIYLIFQIFVNVIISSELIKNRNSKGFFNRRKINSYLVTASVLILIAELIIFCFYRVVSPYIGQFGGKYELMVGILCFIFFAVLSNTIESLSSVIESEVIVLKSTLISLLLSVLLSFVLVDKYSAIGYCFVLTVVFSTKLIYMYYRFYVNANSKMV